MRQLVFIIIGLIFFLGNQAVQVEESMAAVSTPGEIKRSFKDPNKDLYFRLYDHFRYKAPKISAERVSSFIGLPAEDIVALEAGEFTPVVFEYCQGALFKDNTDCKEEILETLRFENEFFMLEAEMEEQTYATEVWSNASLADSSYDLLTDLNIIDAILFGKRANLLLTRFPLDFDDDDDKDDDTDQDTGNVFPGPILPPASPQLGLVDGSLRELFPPDFSAATPFEFGEPLNQCLDPRAFDPLLLPTASGEIGGGEGNLPDSLANLPIAFAPKVARGAAYPVLPKGTGADSLPECQGEKIFGFFCSDQQFSWCFPNLQSGTEEDSLYFDFSICLDILFENTGGGNLQAFQDRTATSRTRTLGSGVPNQDSNLAYSETDHCVNCHVEFINKTLKDLVAMPLTPRSNTKGSNEIASKFDLLLDAGFTVLFSTKPVLTKVYNPFKVIGSDKEEISATAEHNRFYVELNKQLNQPTRGTSNPDFLEDEAEKNFKFSEEGDFLTDSQTKLRERIALLEGKRADFLATFPTISMIENNTKYWEALRNEFQALSLNMRSVQRLYHYLGDTVSPVIRQNTLECREKQELTR